MKKALSIIGIIILMVIGSAIIINTTKNDDDIQPDSIIEPSEQTGNIPEKIVGDPDQAELIIYEYADYACSHCADWNKKLNELISEYDGQLALIFRYYNLNMTKNSPVVARAATAASLQGYFKDFKDLLFANQAEWYYADADELNDLLADYFTKASASTGDLDKFKVDLNSTEAKKRSDFEQKLSKKVGLQGTPLFRINGETIPATDLTETIKNLLSDN